VTLADATNRLEDSSRALAYNNEIERAIVEQAENTKKILALLEDRLPRAANPNSPELSKKKGGRPPLEWDTMFMWTSKVLLQHGIPRTADELIERMRDACRKAGIKVPAVSTLRPIAFTWIQILRAS
jgi:hypothetical protein